MRGLLWKCLAIVLATATAWCSAQPRAAKAHYVGSASCKPCHAELYAGWKQTRMANVVRDPKVHPEAVLADFTHANPLVTFSLKDVAFVYGSKWKQRYFTKIGDNYYSEPAQWDVAKKKWLPYHVEAGTDWWVPYYGASNLERPTGPLCDGCHSVNYNIETKQPTEWNVGCEKCHGPGSEHVAHPTKENIVNPDRLDYVRANDTCIQCHSQGRTLTETFGGKYYDWPVGFRVGERLADYWRLEDLKPGRTDFFQYADMTAHKNRMQGNDFIQSVMYHRELRCFDCHDVHSNANPANLRAVGNALCLRCHASDMNNPAGLKGTVSEHTHHAEGSKGSQCIACHMPLIEQTIAGNYVASHTFRFITPALTEESGVPNPCTLCHTDKDNAWAAAQLKTWNSVSPWRMAQPLE